MRSRRAGPAPAEQLLERDWELSRPRCRETVVPVPTGEDKPLAPTSAYAVSKRDHEELFLCFGRAYGVPTIALRTSTSTARATSGRGRPTSILELVTLLRDELGQEGAPPEVLNKFREGDIRHCYPDISRIGQRLGFVPRVRLEDGVKELVTWVRDEQAVDLVDQAARSSNGAA